MEIKLFQRHEIDDRKWDETIANSINGTIYGYSFYLDSIAKNWMALIADDYRFILPLPFTKRMGLIFIQSPLFCQRVAIYSANEVTESITYQFLNHLSRAGNYIHLSLDINQNAIDHQFAFKQRTNYVLDLSHEYSEIYSRYNKDAKKSLRTNLHITVEPFNDIDAIINDYILSFSELKSWQKQHFAGLQKAIKHGCEKQMMKSYQVTLEGERIASGLFFIANRTGFYVLGSPTRTGKKLNAIHFLIDHFIKEHSLVLDALDFEGSDIPTVAYFYKKWGSENKPYFEFYTCKFKLVELIFELKNHYLPKLLDKLVGFFR